MISLDDGLCMTGVVEICSLLDATLDGMMDVAEVRLLLVTVTGLVNIADGVMTEASDGECSVIVITLVDLFNDTDVSSIFDAALVELTGNKEINVLLDAAIVNGVTVCSLLDSALVAITDVISSLVVTAVIEVIDCTELI